MTDNISVDDALARIREIRNLCPEVAIKVVTINDVTDFQSGADEEPLTPEQIAAVPDTYGWRHFSDMNDMDWEEISAIVQDVRSLKEPDGAPVEQWEVTTPADVYLREEDL